MESDALTDNAKKILIQKDSLTICGRKLVPPFTLEQVTEVLGSARMEVRHGVRQDVATGVKSPYTTIYYVWDELGIQGRINGEKTEFESFSVCLSPHKRNLPAKPFNGDILINGRNYPEADWKPYGSIDTCRLGGFTLFTCLPGHTLDGLKENIRAVLEYHASLIEISYTPPKPKNKVRTYRLPEPDEPVMKFRNLNFKLAVINILMYEKGLLEPKFDIWEFAREYTRRRIDPENEGYDRMIPEAANWFQRYPVPLRLAGTVTELNMDGGDEINCQLAPNWDGEDDLFDINSIDEAELRQFPDLKRASIFTSNDRDVVPVFRQCGIEVVNAYDVPFEMDKEQ